MCLGGFSTLAGKVVFLGCTAVFGRLACASIHRQPKISRKTSRLTNFVTDARQILVSAFHLHNSRYVYQNAFKLSIE
jgi:hypothetical protein